jgi:hypothetical protein
VNPVERPIRDGYAAARLDLADHAHGQHAVGAGRIAEREVVPSQPPVAVGGQVNHLVDDTIADPGALLAGRAIDEGVVRVELHRADSCRINAVQFLVVALEARAILPGVQLLLHGKVRQRDAALNPMHQNVGVAEAVRVEHLEAVVRSTSDIARSGMRAQETAWASDRLFHV